MFKEVIFDIVTDEYGNCRIVSDKRIKGAVHNVQYYVVIPQLSRFSEISIYSEETSEPIISFTLSGVSVDRQYSPLKYSTNNETGDNADDPNYNIITINNEKIVVEVQEPEGEFGGKARIIVLFRSVENGC